LWVSGFECVSGVLTSLRRRAVKPDFGVAFRAVLDYHKTGFYCGKSVHEAL
jgi:hypothetical protein